MRKYRVAARIGNLLPRWSQVERCHSAITDDNANTGSVTDTQSNKHPRPTGATGRWTPEEDADLTSAFTNTCQRKRGKVYNADWVEIAAKVPGRTKIQVSREMV
jgi:hypothetical protein